MQIMTTPQLTVGVRKALTRIKILECLIKKIESEEAIVSLDFRIVGGVLEYSTDGGTTWNSTVNLVEELDGDFVTLSTPQTITGEKTINATLNMGGNVVPTSSDTYNLGSSSYNYNNIYGRQFLSNSFIVIGSANGQGLLFQANNSNSSTQRVGGFFATARNFFLQAAGTLPADSGHRLQVYGTSWLNGQVDVSGNIIPVDNNISSLGQISNTFIVAYTNGISSNALGIGVTNSNPLFFYNTRSFSSSAVIARFASTTRNLILQPSGTAIADSGQRLQVYEDAYIQDNIDQSVTTASPTGTYSLPLKPIVRLNLTENITINFTNHTSGIGTTMKVFLIQDATSGRLVTWGNVKFPGGLAPTLSSNANATDILTFIWDGSSWYMENFVPDLRLV